MERFFGCPRHSERIEESLARRAHRSFGDSLSDSTHRFDATEEIPPRALSRTLQPLPCGPGASVPQNDEILGVWDHRTFVMY